jgi:hypothetical protein
MSCCNSSHAHTQPSQGYEGYDEYNSYNNNEYNNSYNNNSRQGQGDWSQDYGQDDRSRGGAGGFAKKRLVPSEPSPHVIFLGLDPDFTEADLQAYLVSNGCNVETVTIIRDRTSGTYNLCICSPAHALTYSSPLDFQRSLQRLRLCPVHHRRSSTRVCRPVLSLHPDAAACLARRLSADCIL